MKGLRKYIAPFAPDQSGAAAVFCELNGMIVILDAGGCAGNICGFDEPRWFESRSAIFSAGLRDMDAILGRDDRLVEKIGKACEKIKAEFIAVIGTPVPAVIGTDYRALSRMIEKKTGIVALTMDTSGTRLYDEGEKKAWKALFHCFSREKKQISEGRIGLIGATPLEFGGYMEEEYFKEYFEKKGYKNPVCYGMGAGISHMREASFAEKNIVLAPSGLEAARYLKKEFGTPYELFCPPEVIPDWKQHVSRLEELSGKKVLVVHQQAVANSIRQEILASCRAQVRVASWFMLDREWKEEGDLCLKEEDDWIDLVNREDYDVIIADPLLKRAVPNYVGIWWDLPHFAVSGKKR
ncbi:MAG: nitrogenase component 1 [Eubacterium sp.]|nr:nitrogenase component 1 [Eubacterium sp.]MDD7209537.1 nitrogenase component 1 [Lachnospiraceae bacterium]MDY5498421.1 nitrogenase component 1 [Anaerobutyricum sp.]